MVSKSKGKTDYIHIKRIANVGPNNTTLALDIDLDLPDSMMAELKQSEIVYLGTTLISGGSGELQCGIDLDPEANQINGVDYLTRDSLIHVTDFQHGLYTVGSPTTELEGQLEVCESVRQYPDRGIPTASKRVRFIMQSGIDLSGSLVSVAVYFRIVPATADLLTALLRRR